MHADYIAVNGLQGLHAAVDASANLTSRTSPPGSALRAVEGFFANFRMARALLNPCSKRKRPATPRVGAIAHPRATLGRNARRWQRVQRID
jgi:hypothetical protein